MSENIINDSLNNNDLNEEVENDLLSVTTEEKKISNPDLEMMDKIASDQQDYEDVKALTSSRVTDQLKIFAISQARNELKRIVKLTKYLDKIERSYMDTVDEAIDSGSITFKEYGEIIGLITSLLARSNTLLSNVLKDNSLTAILNTTVYTDNTTQTASVVANLNNPHSREKVRSVISQILLNTQKYVEEPDYSIIEESEDND